MASIVVCGGSVIGLSAAAMLAADGHTVTVLESDPTAAAGAPRDAWRTWRRSGVAQFRQPHNLFSRFRQVADQELPGLTGALLDAGCVWVDPLQSRPPTITDFVPVPADDAARFVTGRRPVVESAVAGYAQRRPGVTVRRGVRVASLLTGPQAIAGTPHVTGVVTTTGERFTADLVVDATGRRSPAERWLADIDAAPPLVEAADRGYIYYTRYFTGRARPIRMAPGVTPVGSFSVLTLDGDNDTWSVTVYGLTKDKELKAVRDPALFDRVIGACPRHKHWLDGKPLTEVMCMAGVLDRYRRLVVDGKPVVTGFVAVGDAWACTNPSAGRGLSAGLVHAQVLRKVVREHLDNHADLAVAMDEDTEQYVTPFYRSQVAADRVRIAEMTAERDGHKAERMMSDLDRLTIASSHSAAAFRGLLEIITCMAFTADVLARPAVKQAIAALGDAPDDSAFGPNRPQLLDLLNA